MSSDQTIVKVECAGQLDAWMKKPGPRVSAGEFEALKHARSLRVPVPTAHGYVPEAHAISMEYIEGDCLENVWPTMSEGEKISIAQQLGHAMSLMRSRQQTDIRIGVLDNLARDCRRYGDYTSDPFTDEASFSAFILDLYT